MARCYAPPPPCWSVLGHRAWALRNPSPTGFPLVPLPMPSYLWVPLHTKQGRGGIKGNDKGN